jgi:hypothetical protein
MQEPFDEISAPLPDQLVRDLQQAVVKALGSLDTLRISLRTHVRKERRRGASLKQIDAELRVIVERMEEAAEKDGRDAADGELTAQITKWSKSFFA